MAEPLLRYRADFNDLRPDDLISTLVGFDGSVLVPQNDQIVELFDADGNTCRARVDHVEPNGLIYVRPDWQTWRDGLDVTAPDSAESMIAAMMAKVEGVVTGEREIVEA
jgi:hypothetical protein